MNFKIKVMHTACINEILTLFYKNVIFIDTVIRIHLELGPLLQYQINVTLSHWLLNEVVVQNGDFRGSLIIKPPWTGTAPMVWKGCITKTLVLSYDMGNVYKRLWLKQTIWLVDSYNIRIITACLLCIGLSVVLIAWETVKSYRKTKLMSNLVWIPSFSA